MRVSLSRARPPSRSAALAATLVAVLGCASVCAPARADIFGSSALVSAGVFGGGAQQAEYAHDAVVSGDGRYVAFDGSVSGISGVWRRDLAANTLELVAGGDAELPSISENGRYISFTTTAKLVGSDESTGPNVWVADMEATPGDGEYRLVSAEDGSERGLVFSYPEPRQEEPRFGAVAAGRTAISANGQQVAFVTTAVSSLAGLDTPALQVAVRDMASEQTTLVSETYDPQSHEWTGQPVSVEDEGKLFGAVYPGSSSRLGFMAPPANGEWESDPPPGASISADGSTVAWMGEDIPEQAPMLAGEHASPLYTEPLWRRIAPGSETRTERITGGSDPSNPACIASGESALPPRPQQSSSDPCQGPFAVELNASGNGSRGIWSEAGGGVQFVPRLSADGYEVAFASTAVPLSLGSGFSGEAEGESADLYLTNMQPGLSRDQALTPVTEIAGTGVAESDPVTDFAISPNGHDVAFTTRRTRFPLGFPAYVSEPAAEAGESELFDADLQNGTLTRVSRGYAGEASEQSHRSKIECPEDVYCAETTIGAQSPSFSTDGSLIAFSSTASNLVRGDGNAPPAGPLDGSDAFLLERVTFTPQPTPQLVSPAPALPLAPLWRLGASVLSRSDGSVLVYVQLPGAGKLLAEARASVTLSVRVKVRGKRTHTVTKRTVLTRTVASSGKLAGSGELVTLVLKLAKPYAALAQGGGLSGTLGLAFSAGGHPALHESLSLTFRKTTHKRRTVKRAPRRKGGRR